MAAIGAGIAVLGAWVFAGIVFVGRGPDFRPRTLPWLALLMATICTFMLIDAAAGKL